MIPKRATWFAVVAFAAVLSSGWSATAVPRDTIALAAARGLGLAAAGQASGSENNTPNFSGTWRLDAEASAITTAEGLYGLGGAAPENLYITQARNGALILSSRINGAQARNYLIGGDNALPAPGGELERMTVASRWDGDALVNEGTAEFEGGPVVVREVLTLEDGGATLRIVATTTIGGEQVSNALVYRKAAR